MESKIQTIEDARKDSFVQYARTHTVGMLCKRYETAVVSGDVEEATVAAREYRNKLLDECDNMMVSDRPNVDENAWRTYRQQLRDITLQTGFPLNIDWPERPE